MPTQEEYEAIYTELIGFTPPRIKNRICAGLELDPELLDLVEKIRGKAMYPESLGTKTAQMILFAVLLSQVSPAAEFHARAAMRAGASKKELHDVAGLAFLFRGLPAFNLAAEILNKIYDERDGGAGHQK